MANRPALLLARLRAFAGSSSAAGVTVSRHAYRLRALALDQPALIVPLSGTKRVHAGPLSVQCTPGSFVMLHHQGPYDVENQPDGAKAYRALAFGFPWPVVDLARRLWRPAARTDAPLSVGSLAPLTRALDALLGLDDADDPALREHALVGLLLALAQAGHDAFLCARAPSLGARVRALVVSDLGKSWRSVQLERALHVSGATLRRQLAAEGTSLRALLREARLHRAAGMLQTSQRSVKSVAAACGYRSVASFRRQFQARFGVSPSRLANDRANRVAS